MNTLTIVGLIFTAIAVIVGGVGAYIGVRQYIISKKQFIFSITNPPLPGSRSPLRIITIINEMFQDFDHDIKKILATLAVFKDNPIPLKLIAAITQLSESECKNIISNLKSSYSIVQEPSEAYYTLDSMVRLSTSIKKKLDKLKDKKVYDKITDYYLNLAQKNPNQLKTEISNVINCIDWCYKNRKWKKVVDFMLATDNFFDSKGNWTIRRTLLKMAIKAAKKERDSLNIAIFKEKFGVVAMKQGSFEEAKKMFEDNLKIAKKLENEKEIADNLHWQARVSEASGDYEEAEKLYNESLKINRKLGNKRSIADNLHESGVVAYRVEDYERAKMLYEEALKLEREINYERTMTCTLHALALLFQEEDYRDKNYEEAEKLYNESLKIKRKLNDLEEIALTLYELASLLKKEGRYEEAIPLCSEAVEIFEKLDHRYLGTVQNLCMDIKKAVVK